jgi:hypothetical protein
MVVYLSVLGALPARKLFLLEVMASCCRRLVDLPAILGFVLSKNVHVVMHHLFIDDVSLGVQLVGMDQAVDVYYNLVSEAKQSAGLPADTKLVSLVNIIYLICNLYRLCKYLPNSRIILVQ